MTLSERTEGVVTAAGRVSRFIDEWDRLSQHDEQIHSIHVSAGDLTLTTTDIRASLAEARRLALAEVALAVDTLSGIDIRIDQEHIYADDRAHAARFIVPPRTVTVTNGGPLLDRAAVLRAIEELRHE